jgi:hypothetical protein
MNSNISSTMIAFDEVAAEQTPPSRCARRPRAGLAAEAQSTFAPFMLESEVR